MTLRLHFTRAPLLLVLALLWLPSPAQSRLARLRAALPSMLDSAAIPGMSIALIENGRVTWSTGLGVKDKATKQPVSSQTIFRGASLGKPLFAYAVLGLSETGKLALDTPLVHYAPLPYLETQFLRGSLADERIKLITARMVLTHTSGLPNWRAEGRPLTTLFSPGSRYSYSGEGYYLLQTVVEYLTGQPIEAFMQRTVFGPLGMTRTSYAYRAADSLHYARAYDQSGAPLPEGPEPVNVAHTLRTCAGDYARFLTKTLLRGGKGHQTAKALIGPLVNTDICQPGQVSWGLGLAVQHAASGDLFCQWAKSPAASGYFIGSAEQQTAVVYLVNVANQGLRIAQRVVQLSLDYEDPLFGCFGVRPYNAKQ